MSPVVAAPWMPLAVPQLDSAGLPDATTPES
jgi:hypothetical protein